MRIIVADGNSTFRNVVVAMLRAEGHDVIGVADGAELVVEAKAHPPAVIIAHVSFDDSSALEALELLEARGVRVPTIITSGARVVSREEARRLRAVAVLPKPLSMDVLRKAIAAAAVTMN